MAIDRDPAVLARAAELGLADETVADAAAGVAGADHVILCVPVGAYGAVAQAIAGSAADRARSSPTSAR